MLWLHKRVSDAKREALAEGYKEPSGKETQITLVTQWQQYPGFMNKRVMQKFRHLEQEVQDLKIKFEPYADCFAEDKALMLLINA